MVKFWHREEKLAAAESLGFQSIEVAITTLYRCGWSTTKIGEHFQVTGPAIRYVLRRMSVPSRPQGGRNNPYGKPKLKGETLTMIQPYKCILCGYQGRVTLPDDATVLRAINTIKRDHAARSPHCTFSIDTIIVDQPLKDDGTADADDGDTPREDATHG